MLFEILSTGTMLGVMGGSYYFQHNQSKDNEKIEKIAERCNLYTSEEKIRLYRKHKRKDHIEYVYKIPLGMSFKQFEEKKQTFIDGLNNKSKPDLNIANIKKIDWKKDVPKQIKHLMNNRVALDKQVEMVYDGMLKFRVYDQGLLTRYDVTKQIMSECKKWHVPLGESLNSRIIHDFEKSSHVLIGGATDTGKSTILNIIISTLVHNHPDDVEFTLVDLKGGLEFGAYENIKQTKNFATDAKGALDALRKVQMDMSDIFQMLRKKGKKNIKQTNIKKRHFVIIDEAAELASDGESDADVKKLKIKCEGVIKDIARRGRASGIKLLYCTQYPTKETVSSQVKRNLLTRICLPVDTSTASIVVLDEGGAEQLPDIPGRAIYKKNRCSAMQSFCIEDELIEDIIKPHKEVRNVSQTTKENREGGSNITIFEET